MVNYERIGSGRTLLLLHGWGDNSSTFRAISKELSKIYELISVDLPGFGGTQRSEVAWGLEEYARFVAEFLKKIEVSDVYAIIGHSNGGAIAVKGLANNIFHANKLILIASAGIRLQNGGRKLVWKLVTKAAKVAAALLPETTRQKLRGRLYKGIGSDYLVVPGMEATFRRVVGEDIQIDALLLDVPTLLIYGTEDSATLPQYGEILNRAIAGSRLQYVEGAGHFVHQERADEVISLMGAFLK